MKNNQTSGFEVWLTRTLNVLGGFGGGKGVYGDKKGCGGICPQYYLFPASYHMIEDEFFYLELSISAENVSVGLGLGL